MGVRLMKLKDEIAENVKKLPENFQAEVLDFIKYLIMKYQSNEVREKENEGSSLSLNSAMSGMENEDTPYYDEKDIKVKFS